MKKAFTALALAGAIFVSGCASLSLGGLDINAIVTAADAVLKTGCTALNGALPTVDSIRAFIAANPRFIVVADAIATGENIAHEICLAAAKQAAIRGTASLKAGTPGPLIVDGVPIYFQ